MRNTTLIVLLLVVLITPFTNLHAQAQITSCNTLFTDNGNESNYFNSTNDEWLICPDDSTQYLKLLFTHVDIEAANTVGEDSTGCYDLLYIYDGKDATAPLIGSFCGEESGSGKSSFIDGHTLNVGDSFRPKNSEGCFFIRFESDQSKTLSGWIAEVTCCTPSLENGLTDGIDVPIPTNNGNIFDLVIDNNCTRYGNMSMFTKFEPSGDACYTKGLTYENQSFYAFTTNPSGGFVEFQIDSLNSVGEIEMLVYGPVTVDSLGNYEGGFVNDCVTGVDPWSLFFNAGPTQLYILGVATEYPGSANFETLPSTVGLGGILPVTMIDYKINKKGESVELTWTTAQELKNDKFEIYRSLDGEQFTQIGSRKASSQPKIENTYTFTDHPRTTGNIYYYVIQVDLDGNYTEFGILNVNIEKSLSELSSYPNPSVGGKFSLAMDEKILDSEARLQLFNSTGAQIINLKINGQESFDFPDLEPGLYTIKIISGSTIMTHQHLIY